MKLFNIIVLPLSLIVTGVNAFSSCQRCGNPGAASNFGVGPSYNAGKDCGFKNYNSIAKCWATDVGYNKCFDKKCRDAGKNYYNNCPWDFSRTGTLCF